MQREGRKVRSARAEDTNTLQHRQAKLADALKWAKTPHKKLLAQPSAVPTSIKLSKKLQIERQKTAKLQLEEELAKAWACLSLMDEGRGGGCSLDIEAAMAQVVAAGRQKRQSLNPSMSTSQCKAFFAGRSRGGGERWTPLVCSFGVGISPHESLRGELLPTGRAHSKK